jgi:hypothetical protein
MASGRIGVVIAVPEHPAICHRPRVRILTNEGGLVVQEEMGEIDLGLRDEETGEYPDEILGSVDAESLGIEISKYFI